MMVMTLSLLVYSAAEFLLRKRLAEAGETVPNQVGKPTSTPTLRRVFQIFEGIEVLTIAQAEHQQRLILNLRDEHRHLLKFMEPAVINLYRHKSLFRRSGVRKVSIKVKFSRSRAISHNTLCVSSLINLGVKVGVFFVVEPPTLPFSPAFQLHFS